MTVTSPSIAELGLMGGMFDPVHNGHLAIAFDSIELLHLDAMVMLPCGQPVHGKQLQATAAQRMDMLALATAGHAALRIDDRECRQDAPSYTCNTLAAIRKELPQTRLYYLVGQDAFNQFHTWYHWREIFSLVHVVVAARPGYQPEYASGLQEEIAGREVDNVNSLKTFTSGKVLKAELELMDISSSLIRDRIMRNENIGSLVPQPVADYIVEKGLYLPEMRH